MLFGIFASSPGRFLLICNNFKKQRNCIDTKSCIISYSKGWMSIGWEYVAQVNGESDHGYPSCYRHFSVAVDKRNQITLSEPKHGELEWLVFDVVETRITSCFDGTLYITIRFV
jgi:hypothetical protein